MPTMNFYLSNTSVQSGKLTEALCSFFFPLCLGQVEGSPYGDMAFCEQFPRPLGGYSNVSIAPLGLVKQGLLQVLTPDQLQTVEVSQMAAGVSDGDTFVEYWAQVGKASNMLDNYDNIFSVSKVLLSFDAAQILLKIVLASHLQGRWL